MGEFDAAIGDFTGAIEFDPNFAGAHHMRGLTYDDKGEYDRAIADYARATETDPQFARAYNRRDISHRAKGDVDRAIAGYTKALELIGRYPISGSVSQPKAFLRLGSPSIAARSCRNARDRGNHLRCEETIADLRQALSLYSEGRRAKETLKRLGALT